MLGLLAHYRYARFVSTGDATTITLAEGLPELRLLGTWTFHGRLLEVSYEIWVGGLPFGQSVDANL
jgi:hypothetical protein